MVTSTAESGQRVACSGSPSGQSLPRLAGRIPELDGLRGVAVIAVLAFHLRSFLAGSWFYAPASLGWSGVDLFFVLSGFLITSILLKDRDKPRHFFRNFYARRALRIVPAYLVLLIICNFGPVWLHGRHMPGLSRAATLTALLLWVQNLAHAPVAGPLAPTWSLAIEQQYYLSWAPVVRFIRRPLILALILAALLVVSPVCRMHPGVFNPTNTLLHLDGISIGGLVALGTLRLNWSIRTWLRLGLVMGGIGFTWLAFLHGGTVFADSALALAFAGTLVASVAGSGARNPAAWLLRRGPLPFYGKISYGLYLIHIPVFIWMGFIDGHVYALTGANRLGNLIILFAKVGVATLAALVLWHGLEKRVLRLKRYFPGR